MLTRRITPAFALGIPALAFFQPYSRWCKNEMHCAVINIYSQQLVQGNGASPS